MTILPLRQPGRGARRRPQTGACRLLVAATLGMFGAIAASAGAGASSPSGTVNLVAYSTPAPAYQVQIRAFNATAAGKHVSFTQSYGPSGSQAKSVIAGQPADVVNFASATDIETLVAKKLVSLNWNANAVTKGMVTDSVVVFVVPKGNPKHVGTWADLLRKGTRVFTPNPFSSGSARWNLMAAYGAQVRLGATSTEAQSYVKKLLQNTVVQGTSAGAELQAFLSDEGAHSSDVFLDYESDAIQAIRGHDQLSYVVPKQTILIENPIAVTAGAQNRAAATSFYNYLLSPAGQREWAKLGYRPVLPAIAAETRNKFPHPAQLFTIGFLGGWDQVNGEFFSTSTSTPGMVTQIESSLGQST